MSATSDDPTDEPHDGMVTTVTGAPAMRTDPITGAVDAAALARHSRGRGVAMSVLPPLLLGAAVIGVWYFITYQVLDPGRRFLLSPPHQVLTDGFLQWNDVMSDVTSALWTSTKTALIGLGVSIVLGFGLAILMSQARAAERALFPYLVMLQAIPILALIPLIQFWFGTGQTARVIVCVLIAVFPIIVNTLFGLQSADRSMHDLFTLHRVGAVTRLRKLMFPAGLPAIFAGLRISAGLSVIGAIVGDFFFGKGRPGLGRLLKRYATQLDGPELLTTMIVTCALGVAVFLTFGFLQTLVIGRWHDTAGPRP